MAILSIVAFFSVWYYIESKPVTNDAMIENAKELLATLKEKSSPLATETLNRMRKKTRSLCGYVRSVTDRMTVKERLLVLFAVGVVIGFGVKAVSNGTLTIGYQDYALKGKSQAYDLNEIQRKVIEKNASVAAGAADPTAVPEGGSCQ